MSAQIASERPSSQAHWDEPIPPTEAVLSLSFIFNITGHYLIYYPCVYVCHMYLLSLSTLTLMQVQWQQFVSLDHYNF